ncbi:MAG TPA: FtsX-like permease family protein, partial [Rhodospirillales bacterium]|nr:FtsX-like permease family protein [Rhodospirillales bacterium]
MTDDFNLAWRLARRELRGGLTGFRVFLTCIALGVGAIAAVGGLSQSIVAGLDANGTRLLGGEVDLRLLHRPATVDQIAYLEAQSQILSAAIKMRAMVRPALNRDKRAMVELKAVDAAYPLIGQLETSPPLPRNQLLGIKDGTWGAAVDANLLTRLGLTLGDTIQLGAATFQMRATVALEPDRIATVFSFGPRLMISSAALAATGLVQPGSQIRYHYRMMMKPGIRAEDWTGGLETAFPVAGWRINTSKDAAHGVRRFIDRMTLFMTFVGLTVLLVGGLGVTGAVRSYLDGKTATIATFKCLGAPGRLIFAVYMMQILILGGLGVLIGLVFGVTAPFALIETVGQQLPVAPVAGIYGKPIINAAAFGLLATVTFALLPVAQARTVKAAELFRARVTPVSGRPGAAFIAAAALGFGMLMALTLLTANDQRFALWFIGGAIVALVLLRGGAALVMAAAARFKPFRSG